MQVSTINLHPSQHNPIPGTVTSTTNLYVPRTACGSINNTDNHAFQATFDLIVNNMASMQTQHNHVIDMQNVPITGDQHAKQSNYSQPDMTAPMPGVYNNTQHNIVQAGGQAPPKACTFLVCIICLYHQVYLIMFLIQVADPVIHYRTLVALYLASGAW